MFTRSCARTMAAFSLLLAALSNPTLAGDITVNTTADDNLANGSCSLREAMQAQFNGAPHQGCSGATAAGPNVIKFSANGTYSVPVQLADAIAGRALQITGADKQITISCTNNRLFEAELNASLSMDNLTLLGCTSSGAGLAINSKGADLSLTNVTIRNFRTTTAADGAAIAHNGGNLSLTNVVLQGNKIDDGNANTFSGSGGALAVTNVELPKTVNIVNTTFDSNRADRNGGGVYINNNPSLGHSITFTNVVFIGNQAFGNQTQDGGGGAWIQTGSEANDLLLMTAVFFRSNSAENGAGGGLLLANGSRLSYVTPNVPSAGGIFASHFFNNQAKGPAGNDGSGGAIFARGQLTVVQSSFDSNKSVAGSGGAIAFGNNGFEHVLANTTFHGNAAAQNGGAIARLNTSDVLKLINVTIAGNAAGAAGSTSGGGGIYNVSGSSAGISVRNSIVGDSTGTVLGIVNVGGNCVGGVGNLGNNLQFAPNAGCGQPAMTVGDPLLGPLVPATGPNLQVWTLRLDEDGSPALETGDNATCEAGPILRFDATGTPLLRPWGGSRCDIGAFESNKQPGFIFASGFESSN